MATKSINFVRKELKDKLKEYRRIDDCIAGESAIKAATKRYLPIPNIADTSKDNLSRYNQYLERAVFYNVTQQTLYGIVGYVYTRDATIELPAGFEQIQNNADGTGLSLIQLSKKSMLQVVSKGRSGLFVDYPQTDGSISKEELDKLNLRPTITVYKPEDIINWQSIDQGAEYIISMVVLREDYEVKDPDDEFKITIADQWRVLRLTDFGYECSVWRKDNASLDFIQSQGPFYPQDKNGNRFNRIPFSFIGSENNDATPDIPPLYTLASVNVAHYRNSADYEESCFVVGQPTPWVSGLSKDWVDTVLEGELRLGSRGAVPLPEGAAIGLLQVAPNTMAFEAMEHKERQMLALGAKLIEQKDVQRTATQSKIENTAETSTLSSAAKNVSEAYQTALEWCAKFLGVDGTIKFALPSEFEFASMTGEERAELVREWQAGAISFTEMRDRLRKAGVTTLTDAKAKSEISNDLAASEPVVTGNRTPNGQQG